MKTHSLLVAISILSCATHGCASTIAPDVAGKASVAVSEPTSLPVSPPAAPSPPAADATKPDSDPHLVAIEAVKQAVDVAAGAMRQQLAESAAASQQQLASARDELLGKTADVATQAGALAGRVAELKTDIETLGTLTRDLPARLAERREHTTPARVLPVSLRRHMAVETSSADSSWARLFVGSGLACVVLGFIFVALTSGEGMGPGGLLALGGVVLTCVGALFAFPASLAACAMAGVGCAVSVTAFAWCVYHVWLTQQIYLKTTAALNDLEIESRLKRADGWNQLDEHLKRRLGSATGFWTKTLGRRLRARDLIAAEVAISTEPDQAAK